MLVCHASPSVIIGKVAVALYTPLRRLARQDSFSCLSKTLTQRVPEVTAIGPLPEKLGQPPKLPHA